MIYDRHSYIFKDHNIKSFLLDENRLRLNKMYTVSEIIKEIPIWNSIDKCKDDIYNIEDYYKCLDSLKPGDVVTAGFIVQRNIFNIRKPLFMSKNENKIDSF